MPFAKPAGPPAWVLEDAGAANEAVRSAVPERKVSLPLWALGTMFTLAFIAIFLTVIVIRQSGSPEPPVKRAPPMENPSTAATSAAIAANPALKYVEITGLRLLEDSAQKAWLQFVIVNHSGGDLGELSGKLNLKAVTSQNQEPVGVCSFKVPLGPYEAKDVKVQVETKLRVYELPDWQFLRVEIAGP